MSASLPIFGILSGANKPNRHQGKEADPWNLPPRSSTCYSNFARLHDPNIPDLRRDCHWLGPFHRHRYRDRGHLRRRQRWQRPLVPVPSLLQPGRLGHRYLRLFLAKLVGTILAPGSTLFWAVDDTLCRKRGLTLYGAGMHYDPLISSRAKSLVSWGHDWVVLCLIIVKPFWAPTKVFALPIAVRSVPQSTRTHQGEKEPGQSLQTQS